MPDEIKPAGLYREFEMADIAGEAGQLVAAGSEFEAEVGGTIGRALMRAVECKTGGVVGEIDAVAVEVNNGFVRQRFKTLGPDFLRRRFARHAGG